MAITDSLYTFSNYVYDQLVAAKDDLGLVDVYYGDQDRLPRTPSVCVDPGQKTSTLSEAQRTTSIEFIVYVYIYANAVDSVQENKRTADKLGEDVERLLNQDPTCGGTVIHGYSQMIESGYVEKSGGILRSSRITFSGQSKSRLPAAQWN